MIKATALLLLASITLLVAGCGETDTSVSRVPTKTEIDTASANRINAIDKLNIPADQKQKMKDAVGGNHPGGPPPGVATPDAGKR